ncbi:MAG: glutathione S-transferase family protein [Bdellovibrionaceae bacterium]|nr:glutathione S-transferase family protein [Pseudobdellovibrionaceae bacterium]
MIKLHQYPAVWGLPSLSPFCIKVEAYLRSKKIPYRVIVEKNPAQGPKGKMPFIQDGKNIVPDSTFILDYLDSSRTSGQGIAIQRMLEEHLYFILLYSRWIDSNGFAVLTRDFESMFPFLLGKPILRFLRYRLRRQAFFQGIGRHTADEVYELGRQDICALSEILSDRTYFAGDEFSKLDATIYAFLITVIKQPIESELKKAVLAQKNLVSYSHRIERILFPEFVR